MMHSGCAAARLPARWQWWVRFPQSHCLWWDAASRRGGVHRQKCCWRWQGGALPRLVAWSVGAGGGVGAVPAAVAAAVAVLTAAAAAAAAG
eukprot:CAMPEP_0202344430 /NCGR_PEP_ID=MMETSP1126-20121109/4118_1 /ASSEMBLY_ACC=CAM_ASM_000457 /TAXON_ID=3047 /ORGANISM="Dunaliella tertiolecta, Strain CCMP1320" /LENGTH=90 /DNA_ID=CAMNT_0048935625 /DNA_START=1344 /DNA_END=1613 /DNA_ORIENTATION=+